MEMPELAFNIVDGRWKVKRELRASNLQDLERWIALINHAIDFANEQAAIKSSGSAARISTTRLLFRSKSNAGANNGSRYSSGSEGGSRERGGSRGSRDRGGSHGSRNDSRTRSGSRVQRTKTMEERRPESAGRRVDAVEDTFQDQDDEVYQWLKQLQLQRYTSVFKAKGFATVDFIREVRDWCPLETLDRN
jgi:hypothetical protein